MREHRRSGRFRRGIVYALASLLLLLLSQRPILPRPELVMSLKTVPTSQNRDTVQTDSSVFKAAGRSFIIRPDQQGAQEFDENTSSLLWEREFGSIITTAAASENLSAWGLLDGRVFILDHDGVILRIIDPHQEGIASAHPCIYALAMSEQGESVAILYGILPQYVLVYERKSGFYSLSYSEELQGDLRSAQSAAFSADGQDILVKTADGLFYFDRSKGKGALLHPDRFAGEAELLIESLGDTGFALLKATTDERYAGIIRSGALEAYFPVPPDSFGLSASEDSFKIKGAEEDLVFTRRDFE